MADYNDCADYGGRSLREHNGVSLMLANRQIIAGIAAACGVLACCVAAFCGEATQVSISDGETDSNPVRATPFPLDSEDQVFQEAEFLQEDSPRVPSRARRAETELPEERGGLLGDFRDLGLSDQPRSLLPSRKSVYTGVGTNRTYRDEAVSRNTTDSGNLLGRSPSSVGVGSQRRNPIITDPRIRGSRIGSLAGSGSYWVPARIDLDTMLSKIDSRIISDIVTVKGPYAARYGPGFAHIDLSLLPTPRYDDGAQVHGMSVFDYGGNGQQIHGRQMLWGGGEDWGIRGGYSHRTGNDYRAGDGTAIPASFNSRAVDFSVGRDLADDRHLEVNYLRLDQTNLELPGQAFDINVLGTDAYEVSYIAQDTAFADWIELDAWYNRTAFDGDAQNPGKRRQFPYYDFINFIGVTDVDSMSTGFRLMGNWGCLDCEHLIAGVDFRYIKQALNEISSGRIGFNLWNDANSPIPKSNSVNPGLFAEYVAPLGDRLTITAGTRLDTATRDVLADAADLASLGTQSTPSNPVSFADIVGTDDWNQTDILLSGYVTSEYQLCPSIQAVSAIGYAERAPNLTEMYAAESFMFLLQNGLNTVVGDPLLEKEKLLQFDIGLQFERGRLRGMVDGYFGWAFDYITFENTGVVRGPPQGQVEQVQLKYVNTDLATLAGIEMLAEYDLAAGMTPFATFSYVQGQDQTRNGDFATQTSSPNQPSQRIYGLPRGYFGDSELSETEPLPSIVPMESRLGIRFHQPQPSPRWAIELAARVVARQDRVAVSLFETPTPGFTVFDLRGYWQATDALVLVGGIENLADKTYREHLNFRSPSGIQVYAPGLNAYAGGELSY